MPRFVLRFQILFMLAVFGSTANGADGWVSASDFENPEGLWSGAAAAADGSPSSYAVDRSNRAGDGAWLALTYADAFTTSQVRITADFGFGVVDAVTVEARVGGEWTEAYHGELANAEATFVSFPAVTTDALRFRFHYLQAGYYFWLYDLKPFARPETLSVPSVETEPATAIGETTALMRGRVIFDGGDPTQVRFEYGATDVAATETTPWLGSFSSGQEVSFLLRNLRAGATYRFSLVASNAAGEAVGGELEFTPVPLEPTAVGWRPALDAQSDQTEGMVWDRPDNALDDSRATAARCFHPFYAAAWSPFLTARLPPAAIDQIGFSAGRSSFIDAVEVQVLASEGGDWRNAYSGPFADLAWQAVTIPRGIYAQMRLRFHMSSASVAAYWDLYDVGFRLPPPQVAASSLVSPVFIEVLDRLPAGVVFTPTASGPMGTVSARPLADDRWWIDYPLATNAATVITLTSATWSEHDRVEWTPTVVHGESSVTVRVNDSLLLAADSEGSWRLEHGCGSSDGDMNSGAPWPCRFTEPGNHQVIHLDPTGEIDGVLSVTVVEVGLPEHIAGEVAFARRVEATVQPAGAPVTFTGNAPDLIQISAVSSAGEQVAFDAQPLRRGDPMIIARIGGENGPIVATRTVDEFTLETAGLSSVVVFGQTGIAATSFVMRPYIPDITFDFHMFAHGATFNGGMTDLSLNTSDTNPATGQPVTEQIFDPSTGEVIGRTLIELEIMPGETMYCYSWAGFQSTGSARFQVTSSKSVNGCVCQVDTGGGTFIVPEANDEPSVAAAHIEPGESIPQQEEEQWIPQQRSIPVHDGSCGSSYRLTLGIEKPCPSDGLRATADVNGSATDVPCIATTGPVGTCDSDEMRFIEACNLSWPASDKPCQVCSGTCRDLPLHTGIRTQRNSLTLTDCLNGTATTAAGQIEVLHVDADGYVPVSATGDFSTRNPIPAITTSLYNFLNATPKTVNGTPIQITRSGQTSRDILVRLASRAPESLRFSDQPTITVPAHFDTVRIDEVLPITCLTKSISSGECANSVVVYAYNVAQRSQRVATVFATQAKEYRTHCDNGAIVEAPEAEEWVIADTERVSMCFPDTPPEAKIVFGPGDSYQSHLEQFIPPNGKQAFTASATDKDICDNVPHDDTFTKPGAFRWLANLGTITTGDDVGRRITWNAPAQADLAAVSFFAQDDGLYSLDLHEHRFYTAEQFYIYQLTGLEVTSGIEPQPAEIQFRDKIAVIVKLDEVSVGHRPDTSFEMFDESGRVGDPQVLSASSWIFFIPKPGRYHFRVTNLGRPMESFVSRDYVFYDISITTPSVTFTWEPEGFSIQGLAEARAKGTEVKEAIEELNEKVQVGNNANEFKNEYEELKSKTDQLTAVKTAELSELNTLQAHDIETVPLAQSQVATAEAELAAALSAKNEAEAAYLAAQAANDPSAVELLAILQRRIGELVLAGSGRDTAVEFLNEINQGIARRAAVIGETESLLQHLSPLQAILISAPSSTVKLRTIPDQIAKLSEIGTLIDVIGIGFNIASMFANADAIDRAVEAWNRTDEQQRAYNDLIERLKVGRKTPPLHATLSVLSVPGDLPFKFIAGPTSWRTFDPKFADADQSHLTAVSGSFSNWDSEFRTGSDGHLDLDLTAYGNLGRESVNIDKSHQPSIPIVSELLTKREALGIAGEALEQERAGLEIAFRLTNSILTVLDTALTILGLFVVFSVIGAVVVAGIKLLIGGIQIGLDFLKDWLTKSDLERSIEEQYPE